MTKAYSEREWLDIAGKTPARPDAVERTKKWATQQGIDLGDSDYIEKIQAVGQLLKQYGISAKDALTKDWETISRAMAGDATAEQGTAAILRSYVGPTAGASAFTSATPNVLRSGLGGTGGKKLAAPWRASAAADDTLKHSKDANVADKLAALVAKYPDEAEKLSGRKKLLQYIKLKRLDETGSVERAKIDQVAFDTQWESSKAAQQVLDEKQITKTGYMEAHAAPVKNDSTRSIDSLDDAFPDIYTHGKQYYGEGRSYDDKTFNIIRGMKNNPDKEITMYRSVPKGEGIDKVTKGDWVAITKDYAVEHGESVLKGDYDLLTKKVKASDLFTDGNSIHEFGYDPQ